MDGAPLGTDVGRLEVGRTVGCVDGCIEGCDVGCREG